MRRMSVYPKPWETNQQRAKRREAEEAVAAKARRRFNTAVTKDVNKRVDRDTAIAIAREFVKHGDMRHALTVTGFIDEDTSTTMANKIALRVRNSVNFRNAFDHIVVHFDEHEILTRDRILAGLFIEASDRYGPTTASARVTAWSKLAQLTGLEAAAKRSDDLADELAAPGGVLMVPFVSSIEQWEQAAMTQQARLKADVRD